MKRKKFLNVFISDVGEFILIRVWKKIGESYKLKSCLFTENLEDYEIYEDTWEAGEHEWLPYVKNDVLSTAFC